MWHFISIKRYSYQDHRKFLSCVVLVSLIFMLVGCRWDPLGIGNTDQSIDKVVSEIEKTRQTIDSISSEWRDELPKLVQTLQGLESQVDADVKGIISDTTNQVRSLATQTINLTAAKTKEILGDVNAFVLCDTDFVKQGVREQLQFLIDDLKFWKENQRHLDIKPSHYVCVITPSTLMLYPIDESGSLWGIDTSNMSSPNIMQIFGYNFHPQALPTLELQDAYGQTIRDINLKAAYVTHYQINLDFSNEDFSGVQDAGARVVFRWPDFDDPNTINLALNRPAKLVISNPVFDPPSPTAQVDHVRLKVRVTNVGDSPIGFTVTWKPDPNDPWMTAESVDILQPQAFTDVSFDKSFQYKSGGAIASWVTLSTNDEPLSIPLQVGSPPSPTPTATATPVPIAAAPCPDPITHTPWLTPPFGTTWNLSWSDFFGNHPAQIQIDYQQNLPSNQLAIFLKLGPAVTWWKALQLWDEGQHLLASVEADKDNRNPGPMTVTLNKEDQLALIFWEAAFGGAHTKVYCSGDLTQLPGYTVTFTWLKDKH